MNSKRSGIRQKSSLGALNPWESFSGSWGASTSEVRTRIAAMNRRLRIFVPGGTKICTALENGGSWGARPDKPFDKRERGR